jgi:hypothetical protein
MSSKYLSLQQRVGGAMSHGAYNVASFPEYPQPFNVSSGGKKVGGARKKPSKASRIALSEEPSSKLPVAPKKTRAKRQVPSDSAKPKRKPSKYNLFVRDNMDKVLLLHLAPRDRMKKIAELWKKSKENC